jgi:starch phosphorylase
MIPLLLTRHLPKPLEDLATLALDLRVTWSHLGDTLWRTINPELWEATQNPCVVLYHTPRERFEKLTADSAFMEEFQRLVMTARQYLAEAGWCGICYPSSQLKGVAYFSMEFGVGEDLPLYAGGLGVLAGDHLKAASDLAVPLYGVGLLYQEGYFRQILDDQGMQYEAYPYNDPTSIPIQPALTPSGNWLRVSLGLPACELFLRVWKVNVGRVTLYLLDSNDPMNGPIGRGVTGKLYGGGTELRLIQEVVLGIGGWKALEALGLDIDVCHLNEGHAAFAVLERARRFMKTQGVSFREALWATRAGNVFTTHTPVAAGFDAYSPALIAKYFSAAWDYGNQLGISLEDFLALGRKDPTDDSEPFNMAYLAMRGCSRANGVSQLHGAVSRRIFQPLYPSWPEREVPVGHVTNGVHAPSWNSAWAFNLWCEAYGRPCWIGTLEGLSEAIEDLSDEDLWNFRGHQRADLVAHVRRRLRIQLLRRGLGPEVAAGAGEMLEPEVLTLGFARRFTEYKRPNLLLTDPERLIRLLGNRERPVQIVIAGKAHPHDEPGKRMIKEWANFVSRREVWRRAVFLEDYDMSLAQQLVQGVDVWINTPRRPWEASGTSGMKVLVNGGLNLSVLDGWWAEAYAPDVGWAIGDGKEHPEPDWDAAEADQLYRKLEEEVIPQFYERDDQGIPSAWVAKMRASMSRLAPEFSTNRMVRQYVEQMYVPAAAAFRARSDERSETSVELYAWATGLSEAWHSLRFGRLDITREGGTLRFEVEVDLGDISPDDVQVQLYADPLDDEGSIVIMRYEEQPAGATYGCLYRCEITSPRPREHFTPRIVPYHPEALIPGELPLVLWQR